MFKIGDLVKNTITQKQLYISKFVLGYAVLSDNTFCSQRCLEHRKVPTFGVYFWQDSYLGMEVHYKNYRYKFLSTGTFPRHGTILFTKEKMFEE